MNRPPPQLIGDDLAPSDRYRGVVGARSDLLERFSASSFSRTCPNAETGLVVELQPSSDIISVPRSLRPARAVRQKFRARRDRGISVRDAGTQSSAEEIQSVRTNNRLRLSGAVTILDRQQLVVRPSGTYAAVPIHGLMRRSVPASALAATSVSHSTCARSQ